MVGVTTDEGETLIANLMYPQVATDRGVRLDLGLTGNATLAEASTLTNVNEPSVANGYARIALANSAWSVTGDVANTAAQTFTASGGPIEPAVQGYFIVSTGSTPRLVHYEIDPSPPGVLNDGDSYQITPTITVA